MRILFDFRNCQISWYRGIGRYFLALIETIAKFYPVDIGLLYSEKFYEFDKDYFENKGMVLYEIDKFDSYDIPNNFDFFFIGNFFEWRNHNFTYPKNVIKKCDKIVGILYDLIPFVFAGNYFSKDIASREKYVFPLQDMLYSDHLFSISECTTKDGMKYLSKDSSYFTTIYGGADYEKFRTPNSDKEYVAALRTNNIVFIAGNDKRKNYHGAARAFAHAYETGQIPEDAKLYLICSSDRHFVKNVQEALKGYKAEIGKQVIITNFIPDDEMLELLGNARANIFPSFYEGLGLPILEGYIAGTPSFASSLSSTKELVSEECSFDPYNLEEFSSMIVRIYNDEELCKRSLAFGRELVKKINWENAAKIVFNKLEVLKDQKDETITNKIAVFSVLPPQQTGIAPYSLKTHTSEPHLYDIFSCFNEDAEYFSLFKNNKYENIFPIEFYEYAEWKQKYSAKLYVLGNSLHHKEIFEKAISTNGEDNRYLYMHEAMMHGLLSAMPWKEVKVYANFISEWYPEIQDKIYKIKKTSDLIPVLIQNNIYGIRPIIEKTGIRNIIVNTECAKTLIEKEFTPEENNRINIKVFYHPVEQIQTEKLQLKTNNNEIIVGSFGVPHQLKMSHTLIDALEILNNGDKKYRLLLAGYGVNNFLQNNKKDFVIAYEAPDDDLLYKLMKSVDLAVQLRPYPHGESSGCIAQLLGMSQNILTTKGFVSEVQAPCCHLVEGNVSAAILAEVIKNAVENKKEYDGKLLAEKYSYRTLSSQIYDYIMKNNL